MGGWMEGRKDGKEEEGTKEGTVPGCAMEIKTMEAPG